jgi:hypothetical protein
MVVDHSEERKALAAALRQVLAICRDRQAFVMQGPRAFARAEKICKDALVACGEHTEPSPSTRGTSCGENP